jgi:DNA invertase Pin-like site-specific DNA recombinase
MKIALYARVSKPPKGDLSDQQRRDQDPEVQLRQLREWAEKCGHTIVEEYVDRISGKTTSRPGFDRLMADATKGRQNIEAVVVWRLDRFGRSMQHLQNSVALLRDANVAFISLKEGFDLTNAMGKAFFGMLCVFAEFERDLIIERTKAGMANARAKGHLPGRKIDPAKGPSRTTLWRRGARLAS